MSVVGSASVLAVHERRKLQLALHEQQRDSRVREAHGVLERRQRVRRIDAAREARQTRNLARRLGISAEEIVDIRRRFRDLDEDGSGELDLREVEQLCRTSGRFQGLSRDELQQLINEYDKDGSATLTLDEVLHFFSPRRAQHRQLCESKAAAIELRKERHWERVHQSRQRFAWNLYNKYDRKVHRFARKMGYTDASLEEHRRQFARADADGSGEIDLDELQDIALSLGKRLTREELKEELNRFDWKRIGRIDLHGYLELMSPRRAKFRQQNIQRQEQHTKRKVQLEEHRRIIPKLRLQRREQQKYDNEQKLYRKLGFGEEAVNKLRRRFDRLDSDNSGEICLKELCVMLKSDDVPERLRRASRPEVQALLNEWDHDGSGTISFREILDMMSPRRQAHWEQQQARTGQYMARKHHRDMVFASARNRAAWGRYNAHLRRLHAHGRRMGFNEAEVEQLRARFEELDADHSGMLDLGEVTKLVRGEMGRVDLTRDDIKIMMESVDYLRCGQINFAGFLEMMSPRRQRARTRYLDNLQRIRDKALVTSGLQGGSVIFPRRPESRLPLTARRAARGRFGGRGSRASRAPPLSARGAGDAESVDRWLETSGSGHTPMVRPAFQAPPSQAAEKSTPTPSAGQSLPAV